MLPETPLSMEDGRLPRTLGAWLAGLLLGLAGAVAQGLFRNLLADSFLLGSASGAALGVALALALLGVSPLAAEWLVRVGLTGSAFIGGRVSTPTCRMPDSLEPVAPPLAIWSKTSISWSPRKIEMIAGGASLAPSRKSLLAEATTARSRPP